MMTRDDDALRQAYARLMSARRAMPGTAAVSPEIVEALATGQHSGADREALLEQVLADPGMRAEFLFFRDVARQAPKARTAGWRGYVRPLALAAAAVMAVTLGSRVLAPGEEPLRGGEAAISVVAPGRSVEAGAVSFAWRSLPRAVGYDVDVTHEDGSTAATSSVTDTTATIPLGPTAGELRWWVTARLDDGTTIRSAVQALTVQGR